MEMTGTYRSRLRRNRFRFHRPRRLLLFLSLELVIDLLRAQPAKSFRDENAIRQTQARVDQQRIDDIIAGFIPSPMDFAPTGEYGVEVLDA